MFVVFTRRASVFVPLKAILMPACLNKSVNLPDVWRHEGESGPFFILPWICELGGRGGVSPFLCNAVP